jgi:hypothetical protein
LVNFRVELRILNARLLESFDFVLEEALDKFVPGIISLRLLKVLLVSNWRIFKVFRHGSSLVAVDQELNTKW